MSAMDEGMRTMATACERAEVALLNIDLKAKRLLVRGELDPTAYAALRRRIDAMLARVRAAGR